MVSKTKFNPSHGASFATHKIAIQCERTRMKTSAIFTGLLIFASTGYAANAAPLSDYSDISVVSVTPRNPNLKPFVMAIFTKEQQERIAALKKDQPLGR